MSSLNDLTVRNKDLGPPFVAIAKVQKFFPGNCCSMSSINCKDCFLPWYLFVANRALKTLSSKPRSPNTSHLPSCSPRKSPCASVGMVVVV